MKKIQKNKELLDKMIAEAKSLHKTKGDRQLKLWKEMLKQLPDLSDAWYEIKSIVSTAKFMRDYSKFNVLGTCDLEDAPLVVQMLKNLCSYYNNPKVKPGWMLDTVLSMEEYGISKIRAIGILRCALQVGVLREWFWAEDENAMFVPSMLDTPITSEIAYELVNEYTKTLIECFVPYCDLLEIDVFRSFLKKYLKDVPAEKLHGEIDEDLFTGDLGMP